MLQYDCRPLVVGGIRGIATATCRPRAKADERLHDVCRSTGDGRGRGPGAPLRGYNQVGRIRQHPEPAAVYRVRVSSMIVMPLRN